MAISTRADAIIRCELNGKSINVNNGAETAGLTGLLRCRQEDTGQLQREQELRNGKFLGMERFFDSAGKLTRERSVNERGNSQGTVRDFWPNGQLKLEETADNGETQGLVRRFAQTGKPKEVSFVQGGRTVFAVEYNVQGQISDLQCPVASVAMEDRKSCGFEGRTETPLFGSKGNKTGQRTYDQGRLLRLVELESDGSPARELLFEGGLRVHRKFSAPEGKVVLREERIFEADDNVLNASRGKLRSVKLWGASGQIIEHRRFEDGREIALERWYLNGAMKERTATSVATGKSRIQRESFSDDGVLVRREQLLTNPRDYGGDYVGVQQTFYANGKLAGEETWSEPDARGRTRPITRKQWDESGKLTADDEILEDGSRRRKTGG